LVTLLINPDYFCLVVLVPFFTSTFDSELVFTWIGPVILSTYLRTVSPLGYWLYYTVADPTPPLLLTDTEEDDDAEADTLTETPPLPPWLNWPVGGIAGQFVPVAIPEEAAIAQAAAWAETSWLKTHKQLLYYTVIYVIYWVRMEICKCNWAINSLLSIIVWLHSCKTIIVSFLASSHFVMFCWIVVIVLLHTSWTCSTSAVTLAEHSALHSAWHSAINTTVVF
jgi:hypothetical protein